MAYSDYERGFLDALEMLEYYLEKNRLLDIDIIRAFKAVRRRLFEMNLAAKRTSKPNALQCVEG